MTTNPPNLNWPIHTLVDAYTPRPPLRFSVDGIFMMPSLNVVYGAPGSLKSMLMADVCMCVALANPWLTGLLDTGQNIRTIQNNVMWIDFDNGKRRTDERFDAIGKAYKAPPTTPLFYTSMALPWLDLTKTGMTMDLIDLLKTLDIGFVVMDNLGVISGNADENTVEMIQVMGNLRLVAERTGATVTVIHHQRKMQGKRGDGRQGDSLRGHSSIEASLDLALQVEREANAESVTVRATKARGCDVKPFGALFIYEHKRGSTELETARFYGLEATVAASDKAIIDAIVEAIEGSPNGYLKQSEIVKAVKEDIDDVGQNRIRAILAKMESNGEVICSTSTGKSHAKHYSMPTPGPTQAKMTI